MNTLLDIQSVSKSFGGVKALDRVNVKVNEKQVALMIGPNGSGKTTLINVVSGFYAPDEGKIYFNGRDITALPPHQIYKLGLVRTFQIPSLFTRLTVLENLLVASKVNRGESFLKAPFTGSWLKDEEENLDKALKILQLLKIDHLWDLRASKLSGGQMKLLEIGRSLMSDAKMILLDEPISGVNPTLAHEIFTYILNLRDKLGLTFLIIEHRLDLALPYVDYVYVLAYGKLITQGEKEKVMRDSQVISAYLGG
ncbi:MAG: ABC transporter ATP-binding protein [Nitrososphaerales archaeon]